MGGQAPQPPVPDVVKTGTGGIDPGEARRMVKPLGILHLPKKPGRKSVQDRVDDSRQAATEIATKLKQEFLDQSLELDAPPPLIAQMSLAQVEREIRALLHKKLRTEDEEIMLMLLMVAVVV